MDSYKWWGMWSSMGRYLGQWAPPVFWNFTPEEVQNPEKLAEYLEVCCRPGNSRETQIIAMCWGLIYANRATLSNTIQDPQRVSRSDNNMKVTATTHTSVKGVTVATQTLSEGPCGYFSSARVTRENALQNIFCSKHRDIQAGR